MPPSPSPQGTEDNVLIAIKHNGRRYLFEWTGGCGWEPVRRDGIGRTAPLPKAVWDLVDQLPRPKGGGET